MVEWLTQSLERACLHRQPLHASLVLRFVSVSQENGDYLHLRLFLPNQCKRSAQTTQVLSFIVWRRAGGTWGLALGVSRNALWSWLRNILLRILTKTSMTVSYQSKGRIFAASSQSPNGCVDCLLATEEQRTASTTEFRTSAVKDEWTVLLRTNETVGRLAPWSMIMVELAQLSAHCKRATSQFWSMTIISFVNFSNQHQLRIYALARKLVSKVIQICRKNVMWRVSE